MANYTSIQCGPNGRRSLCSPACTWLQRSREARSPGPSLSLLGQGWHGLGLVLRLLDRPALAPRAGHLCYKMPPSLCSGTQLSQPGLAKLLWIALLCYLVPPMATKAVQPLLSIPKDFNLCCCEMFYFFQGWTSYSILHQLLSQPRDQPRLMWPYKISW